MKGSVKRRECSGRRKGDKEGRYERIGLGEDKIRR